MQFNSVQFAVFLPIVFSLYWAVSNKYRWILLLTASYYFYMCWNPKYIVLIIFITLISYLAGIILENLERKDYPYMKKKWVLIITVSLCLGVLFFFKYFNFLSQSFVVALSVFAINLDSPVLNVLLPVGISFYTFLALGYVIDVYRGVVTAEHHLGYYSTFISFFPQLLAGPIERTSNLLRQIRSEKYFDYDLAMDGARMMLWGFFKKIAVADVVAVHVDAAYGNLVECTGFDLWIAIFLYTVQIYCDFSGYSDIAIGTSKLMGINLMTNFKSPYFSLSVKEFWSRWHISLSTWFRDYVYIPLGGNKCSKIKNYFNLLITFLVSGLWHGANWTFVFWGGLHGIVQILEKALGLGRASSSRICKILRWALVFGFCNLAWVFFRADNFNDAIYIITKAFSSLFEMSLFFTTRIGLSKKKLFYILFNILIVAVYDYTDMKKGVIAAMKTMRVLPRLVLEYAIVVLIVIALINSTGASQFVYFQF